MRSSPFSPHADSLWICAVAFRRADTPGNLIIPQNLNFIYNNFVLTSVIATTKTKRRTHMKRMFGFLIGVVVGGLVGSTIALLLAPEAGEELRTQIRSRGEGFFNDVRHAADERKIELRQKLDEMRAPRES